MSEDTLKATITKVGKEYLKPSTTKELKITIGEILSGKIDLNSEKNKKK